MPRLRLFQIIAPAAGLDTERPSTLIADEATPAAQNVRAEGGVIFTRRGYTTLTTDSVASGVASGVTSGPMLLGDFERLAGTTTAMCATTTALYRWTGTAWSRVKSGLSGTLGGYHSATILNDTWIYTNGVDNVLKWTGTGDASDLTGGSDYQTADSHICRAVINYADRLLLLGTNEDGTDYPYRVRWSELSKIDEFTVGEGGGYADLKEDPSGIQGAVLLGDWCIIYCGHSIWRCGYVGTVVLEGTTVHYRFDRVVPGLGCRAPRTVMDLGTEHIFLGEDGEVYRFNGIEPVPISGQIRRELANGISPDDHIRCFAALGRNEPLYYLCVPYGNPGGAANRAYVYNYRDGTWLPDTIDDLTAAAFLELGANLTIAELPAIPIAELPAVPIAQLGVQAGKRHLVTAQSGGRIYEDDYLRTDDNGVAIDAVWETKDLVLDPEYMDNYKRVQELLFEGHGDNVSVYYSIDLGETWVHAATQELTTAFTRHGIGIDVTCRQIRLRFRNNVEDERFYLRWIGAKYFVTSER